MTAIALTGLPGTGKTQLAIALGAALMAAGHPTLILHTDVLKVTLRQLGDTTLAGPGYAPDFAAKLRRVHPILAAQVAKAQRDGYTLIIEGTLALGLVPEPGITVLLTLPEMERQRRCQQKPACAQAAIAIADLAPYRQALAQWRDRVTLCLDASAPVDELVQTILVSVAPLNR